MSWDENTIIKINIFGRPVISIKIDVLEGS